MWFPPFVNIILLLLLGLPLLQVVVRGSPNIVIVLADDLGFGDVEFTNRAHGSIAKTPVLNALAKSRSTWVLNNMHSESACSPSRIAILTARSPLRDCVAGSPLLQPQQLSRMSPMYNKNADTIAHMARKLNYRTLFLGKYLPRSRNDNPEERPSQLGFQDWFAMEGGSTYDFTCVCTNPTLADCFTGHETSETMGRHVQMCLAKSSPNDRDDYPPRFKMETEVLADKFRKWLAESVPSTSKFLAQIAFRSVHIPFVGSPDLRARCERNEICKGTQMKSSIQLDYGACVFAIDQAVGSIMASIRALRPNDFDNTLFFFVSDNGPSAPTRKGTKLPLADAGAGNAGGLYGYKTSLFEGLLRVPALVHWPRVIKQQRVANQLLSIMDIPATIAHALTRSELPRSKTDGFSFLPSLLSNMPGNATHVVLRKAPLAVCSFTDTNQVAKGLACHQVAVIDPSGQWKIIGKRNPPWLYSTPSLFSLTMSSSKLYNLVAARSEPTVSKKTSKTNAHKAQLVAHGNAWLATLFGDFAQNC